MERLPIEILDDIFEEMGCRELVACRAVSRLWRGLIDGDDAMARAASVVSYQGKLAAAYINLSEPTEDQPYHPGWETSTVIRRNEDWMQRDFARALKNANNNLYPRGGETSYSFNLPALMYEVFGVDTDADEELEPELHGGHLLIACSLSHEIMSSGILHVDLNEVNLYCLSKNKGCKPRREDAIIPEGLSWLPWPARISAWGVSQATHELIIITSQRVDASLPELPRGAVEIHVLDLKTHQDTQPPSIHRLRGGQRPITTLKIHQGLMLIVQAKEDEDDLAPITSPTSASLTIFELKPTVRTLVTLPLDGTPTTLDSADTLHHHPTGFTIPGVIPASGLPPDQAPLPETSLGSKFDEPDLQRSAIELEDGTWLTADLFVVVGTPVAHDRVSDHFYCHLDVYSATDPESLLVRQPVAVKSFFNPSLFKACSFGLRDLRISAEPDACSPIVVTAGWDLSENPSWMMEGGRRDRVFIDRKEMLAIAREQLAVRVAKPIIPIILKGIALSACPLFSTINSSTMHTAHRGRHIGFASRRDLQGETFNDRFARAREKEHKHNDGAYLLTISLVIPSATMRDDMPTAQQLRWLGLNKQDTLHPDLDPSIPKPLEGWVPSAFWDSTRQFKAGHGSVRFPPEERVPSAWATDFLKIPRKKYVAFCRIVDTGNVASDDHIFGDLLMDDDRIVICGRDENGPTRVSVLPLIGPRVSSVKARH